MVFLIFSCVSAFFLSLLSLITFKYQNSGLSFTFFSSLPVCIQSTSHSLSAHLTFLSSSVSSSFQKNVPVIYLPLKVFFVCVKQQQQQRFIILRIILKINLWMWIAFSIRNNLKVLFQKFHGKTDCSVLPYEIKLHLFSLSVSAFSFLEKYLVTCLFSVVSVVV